MCFVFVFFYCFIFIDEVVCLNGEVFIIDVENLDFFRLKEEESVDLLWGMGYSDILWKIKCVMNFSEGYGIWL